MSFLTRASAVELLTAGRWCWAVKRSIVYELALVPALGVHAGARETGLGVPASELVLAVDLVAPVAKLVAVVALQCLHARARASPLF